MLSMQVILVKNGQGRIKSVFWNGQVKVNVVEGTGTDAKAPYEETLEHVRFKAVLENGLNLLQIDVQD